MFGDRRISFGFVLGLLPLVVLVLLGIAVIALYSGLSFGLDVTPTPGVRVVQGPPPTPTATRTRTPTPTATPLPTRSGTATPTLVPGGHALELTPAAGAAGWVASNERSGNHLGDYNLHSGIYSATVYYGLFQFDLGPVPPGTRLQFASVELVGLNRDRLNSGGEWRLSLLADAVDARWESITFSQAHEADVTLTLGPVLSSGDLAIARTNAFEFKADHLKELERRLAQGRVSFRLSGPASGANNLFTWYAGGQQGTPGFRPVLRLGTGPLAPASTPTYIVVTSTPTPRNSATAAALAATASYVASTFGTYTPVPANWVTPVMVTATPQPPDVFAAATRSALMTAQATLIGTATPTPPHWVTPIVVTATPAPANSATATYRAALATAQAATTGTPTPLPFNVVTATPTPLFVPHTPRPSVIATTTPTALPDVLRGKIAFLSDRDSATAAYVMDPDGANVARLTSLWPYQFALSRDVEAFGGAYRVTVMGDPGQGTRIVLLGDPFGPITLFENRASNYDPSVAPDGYHIAFVSNVTGRDEIYSVTRDRTDLRQLTSSVWEWNKHPTWSPDGRRIAWWSNRVTGRRQIWVMNADGSEPVNISSNFHNDWDPVWMK